MANPKMRKVPKPRGHSFILNIFYCLASMAPLPSMSGVVDALLKH